MLWELVLHRGDPDPLIRDCSSSMKAILSSSKKENDNLAMPERATNPEKSRETRAAMLDAKYFRLVSSNVSGSQ